jgi:hypothetical protein
MVLLEVLHLQNAREHDVSYIVNTRTFYTLASGMKSTNGYSCKLQAARGSLMTSMQNLFPDKCIGANPTGSAINDVVFYISSVLSLQLNRRKSNHAYSRQRGYDPILKHQNNLK